MWKKPKPEPTGPGQESVWQYPRPPATEPVKATLKVVFEDEVIAQTSRGYRVLETSHPPVYYFPPEDVEHEFLIPSDHSSFCEFKGKGAYYHVQVGNRKAVNAAWYYPTPRPRFRKIINYIAFYAHMMDACYVNEELATPQPGNFYGGWVTQNIVGPFKGEPGSWGW